MATLLLTHRAKVFRGSAIFTVVLAALACVVRLDRAAIFIPHWSVAELTDVRRESGFASVAPTHRAELSSHRVPSLAQVWEDGRPLAGPANAANDDIRQIGRGRYSFWHAYVYFSASDNSDPRSNGHRYQIYYPWMVNTVTAFALYAFTLLASITTVCFAVRHRGKPEVNADMQKGNLMVRWLAQPPFILTALLLFGVFVITRTAFFVSYPMVGLSPDTASYTSLTEAMRNGTWPHFIIRTPGYPLLLWLVTAIANRWIAVVFVQCLLSLAGALCVVYSVSRLSRSLILPATVAMCAFLGSSQVLIYDTVALSDSFYTSSILFAVAFLLLAFAENRPRHFFLASAAMALAILIRPAGIYFIVIYALVTGILLWRRFGKSAVLAFTLPFPAILTLLSAYNYATIKAFVISPFGEANLVGATILYWTPDPSLPPEANRALQDLPASYQDAGITAADLATIQGSWNPDRLYEVFSQSYNVMTHHEGWALGTRFGAGDYLTNRAVLRRVCLLAIRRHPALYLKFILANLINFFDGISYKFDFYSIIAARAAQHFASADRGYDPVIAKEYSSARLPATIQRLNSADHAQLILSSTFFQRMHVDWEFWHQQFFQRRLWVWGYFIVLFISLFQLLRYRGNHFGAFFLCVLALIVLGASGVTCLVEESMDRYSYPTQFIYYLSVALCPLLWTARWPHLTAPRSQPATDLS